MSAPAAQLSVQEWSAIYRRDDGEQQPISPVEREFGSESPGQRHGLRLIRRMVARLGNPQLRYPTVHVGGSKGKGSTVAALSSILRSAGYRVGTYTSPSLTHFGERILVDGHPLQDTETERLLDRVRPTWQDEPDRPRFFEATTAIAFQHFAEQSVDVAVIEVGLGGRLDATNVVEPEVAIITSIELEHTKILGDTLAEIATEKAGIVKPGVPTITGVRASEPLGPITAKCVEMNSRLWRLGTDFRVRNVAESIDHQTFDMDFAPEFPSPSLDGLRLGLAGGAQSGNAGLAVIAAQILSDRFSRVTESAIRRGLETTRWRGRLELIAGEPSILLDVAHTPASARQLREYLQRFFHATPITLVFGMLRDKRIDEVAAEFNDIVDQVVVAPVKWHRAMEADAMRASFESISRTVEIAPTICTAVERAIQITPRDGLVVVAGSLFAVGESMRRFGWGTPRI